MVPKVQLKIFALGYHVTTNIQPQRLLTVITWHLWHHFLTKETNSECDKVLGKLFAKSPID